MDNITKGDPIKADWANALTNAVNAAAHGKTALRGGGGQNVFISPYQRGSRPLAFDLVEITDDEEGSLSGKISGGVLLSAYKEEQEEKISLKTECMEISEYEATFQSGDKVWVHVTYDPDTWEAYVAILEKGKNRRGQKRVRPTLLLASLRNATNPLSTGTKELPVSTGMQSNGNLRNSSSRRILCARWNSRKKRTKRKKRPKRN